jgi:hypothetical protein
MKKIKTAKQRILEEERKMRDLLARVGYTGRKFKGSPYEIPDYRVESRHKTSDVVCGPAGKRQSNTYTGNELLGIGTMHKSNAVPIRRDSPEGAVEISQMRRN